MSLPGKNDLNRTLGILEDTDQPIRIAQKQVSALLGGETSREADRENARIENFRDRLDFRL